MSRAGVARLSLMTSGTCTTRRSGNVVSYLASGKRARARGSRHSKTSDDNCQCHLFGRCFGKCNVTSPWHHRHCFRFGSRHFTMPPSSLSPIWITSLHHATIITVSDLDHVTSPCHHHHCLRFGSRHFTMPPSSLSPIWITSLHHATIITVSDLGLVQL